MQQAARRLGRGRRDPCAGNSHARFDEEELKTARHSQPSQFSTLPRPMPPHAYFCAIL